MNARKALTRLTMATLLSGFALVATLPAAEAAKPDGKWKLTMSTPQGDMDMFLELKADGEKLSGKVTAMDQATPISEGTIKNDEVAFKVANEFGGQSFVANYKGKIEGDTIKGSTEFDIGGQKISIDWKGTREKT